MHFYRAFGWVENIYCALLSDLNLDYLGGGGDTIMRIDKKISKNEKIHSFLAGPIGKNAEGANAVVDPVLKVY
jgi:hypothetical protein